MVFSHPIRVYWEDTDAGGIVFYANYLKFMERARTEWLRALGIEQQRLREETGGIFVVSETRLKYHRPARLDDQLLVTAQLQESGSASLIIEQRVLLADMAGSQDEAAPSAAAARALLCEGSIRIGWVNATTLRPARLPAHVLQSLTPCAPDTRHPIRGLSTVKP